MNTDTRTKERTNTVNDSPPIGNQAPAVIDNASRTVEYVPMGAADPIKLSVRIIRLILNPKTKSGTPAPDDQILKFIMLCRARRLDPFEGDAYLLGYEGQQGDQWSLITSIYAFLKRAEVNPEFEGMESGVIVETKDGNVEEHIGDFMRDDEKLLGGWATVHRSDRKYPNKKRIEFKRYSTGKSRWQTDPGGMACKVAETQALRDTFPTTLGGMFIGEEMDKAITVQPTQVNVLPSKAGSLKTPKIEAKPETKHEPQPEQTAPESHDADDYGEIPNDPPQETSLTDAEKAAIAEQEAAEAFDPEHATKDALIAQIKRHLTRLGKTKPSAETWAFAQASFAKKELASGTESELRFVFRALAKMEGPK